MIVGIPEKEERSYAARQIHDIEEFTKIANSLIENCPKPIKAIRLGKYKANKDRPLKICFDNNNVPRMLLQKRTKLSENIKIYSDQTPEQKRYLQTVREELDERLRNGEKDLKIKYFKGIPRITQIKSDQKN